MEFDKKQRKIISSKPNGHLLIKGTKGTGKTTAFIHKIPSLLNNYCISKDDKVLIAAYNEEYSKTVSSIYENIETEKYHQNSFFDEDNSDKLEIRTIDSLMLYYFNQYNKENKKNFTIASIRECENELKEAIVNISKKYEKKKVKILNLEYTQFIQEEIKWIKACNYLKLEEYQEANRNGRVNKTSNDVSKMLRKNSKQRQVIYEILIEYNNNLKKINKIDTQDMGLLALEQAKKNPSMKYTHIFIDNSQYLTKVQLEFLKALYNEKSYSSITFIVDNSENITQNAWITKGRSFSSLGYDMKGKCITLNKSYGEVIIEEIEESKDKKDNLTRNNEINKGILDNASLTLGTLEYIDLKRNLSHRFIKDSGAIDEIYVDYDNFEEKVEEVISIPVFNEIAAGSPILINEYIEDNYHLPKEWIKNSKDVFMLKVKGDSMINKNIFDGDYVVISKQNQPHVKDIVAVDIEGEATLKTYKIIDGKIALMPENENYEPIIIEDQQFSFLGVAIGLVKNS
jgi:SOS regulatory protein LexA